MPGTPVRIQLEPDTPLPGARASIIVERLRTVGRVHGTQPAEATLASDSFEAFDVPRTGEEAETIADLAVLRVRGRAPWISWRAARQHPG
jgi:hypothetical protein